MVSIENSHLIVEKLGSRGSCSLSLIWNVGNKVLLEGGVLLKAPTLAFGSMFLEYYGNQNFPMLRSRTLPIRFVKGVHRVSSITRSIDVRSF